LEGQVCIALMALTYDIHVDDVDAVPVIWFSRMMSKPFHFLFLRQSLSVFMQVE